MNVKFTTYLDQDSIKKVKKIALKENKTVAEILRGLLDQYIKERE